MTDRTMPPVGPEMDALVAEALGEDTKFPAYYSRDTHGIAMDALEAWREQHPGWAYGIWAYGIISPDRYLQEYRCELSAVGEKTYAAVAPTLAVAICQVIIRAHWALEDAR